MNVQRLSYGAPNTSDGAVQCSTIHIYRLAFVSAYEFKRQIRKLMLENSARCAVLMVPNVFHPEYSGIRRALWSLRFKLWGLRSKKLFHTGAQSWCWVVKL